EIAADGNGDAAFLENFSIEIYLGALLVEIAACQPTHHGQRRISLVPGPQPALAVDVEGINERKPAIALRRFDARFELPVTGAVGLLDLFLREVETLKFSSG